MSKNRKSNEPPEEPQTGTDDGGFLADEVRPGVSRKPSMRDDRSGVSTVRSSRSAHSVTDSMHSGGGVRYNSIPGGDGAGVTGDGGVNSVSYEDFSRGLGMLYMGLNVGRCKFFFSFKLEQVRVL